MIHPEVQTLLQRAAPETYREVVERDAYELRHNAALLGDLQLGAVLDLGAHVGCFAALAATLWPQTPVHSVEPHPGNHAVLREVAAHYPNVHPHEFALGTTPCWSALDPGTVSNAAAYHDHGQPGHHAIPTRTLAELAREIRLQPPYLVKLDIEGAEVCLFDDQESTDVLRGALLWVAELHCHDPAHPETRHHRATPAQYYELNRETLNRTWRWLHGFTDHQTVVLNMATCLWIVRCRAIRNAPWSS